MPLLYSAVPSIAAVSATLDPILNKKQYASCKIDPKSFADLVQRGRNRSKLDPTTNKSVATLKASPQLLRLTGATIANSTRTKLPFLSVIPAPKVPTGVIKYNGEGIDKLKIVKGKSYAFEFNLTGQRLKYLTVRLAITDLLGKELIQKQVRLAPGGVLIEEFIENDDRYDEITGVIHLLPNETQLLSRHPNTEIKYLFELGNDRDREYLIESGYFLLVKK